MSFWDIFRRREKFGEMGSESRNKQILNPHNMNMIDAFLTISERKKLKKELIKKQVDLEIINQKRKDSIKKLKLLMFISSNTFKNNFLSQNSIKYETFDLINLEEDYFKKIYVNKYDIIIIYRAQQTTIRKMILEAKKHNKNCNVIVFDRHEYASSNIDYGADYFGMIDKNRELEQLGYNTNEIVNLLEYSIIDAVINNIILQKEFTQIEKDIIIQKSEFYNSVADIFDKRSEETADLNEEIAFLNKTLNKNNCKNILDAGCGNGRLTEPLASLGYKITGIDIADKLLKQAISKTNNNSSYTKPRYIEQSIIKTEFRKEEFDATILMWHVICDLDIKNQSNVFNEMHRILRPNGIIIFDFPDKERNAQIKKDGVYEDIGAGLLKYRGMVPEIDQMLYLVERKGFLLIEYHRVHWGIDKYLIVAIKKN